MALRFKGTFFVSLSRSLALVVAVVGVVGVVCCCCCFGVFVGLFDDLLFFVDSFCCDASVVELFVLLFLLLTAAAAFSPEFSLCFDDRPAKGVVGVVAIVPSCSWCSGVFIINADDAELLLFAETFGVEGTAELLPTLLVCILAYEDLMMVV